MPMYTYRREDGTTFDIKQKFADDPLTVDPVTGQHVARVVHAAGIIFKGSGFYVNDSKNKSSSSVNSKSNGKESSDSASPKAESSSSDSASSETKSEAKSDSKSEAKSEAKADPKPAAKSPPSAAAD